MFHTGRDCVARHALLPPTDNLYGKNILGHALLGRIRLYIRTRKGNDIRVSNTMNIDYTWIELL